MSYFIKTLKNTQVRDYWVKKLAKHYGDIEWTPNLLEAYNFGTRRMAEKFLPTAKQWCVCEIWEGGSVPANEHKSNDALYADYDRAMGIIK